MAYYKSLCSYTVYLEVTIIQLSKFFDLKIVMCNVTPWKERQDVSKMMANMQYVDI